MNPVFNEWTEEEKHILTSQRQAGRTFNEITKRLPGRTLSACADKYGRLCGTKRHRINKGAIISVSVPPRVWTERDQRANEPRSLEQILFGDPPFSQSALGRRP